MLKEHKFTFADAYKIQAEQLQAWSFVLNSKAYIRLVKMTREKSYGICSAWQVPRGDDLLMMVYEIQRDLINEK